MRPFTTLLHSQSSLVRLNPDRDTSINRSIAGVTFHSPRRTCPRPPPACQEERLSLSKNEVDHRHVTLHFLRHPRLASLRLHTILAFAPLGYRATCVGKCRRLHYKRRPIPQLHPSHPSAHRLCLLLRPAAPAAHNTSTNPPPPQPATPIMLPVRAALLPRRLSNARRGNPLTVPKETSRLRAIRP